mgnify:CR=1 FL=1
MSDPPPFLNYFYNTLFVFLILPPLFQQILWSPVFHRALSLSVHQSPPECSVTGQRHLRGRSDLFWRLDAATGQIFGLMADAADVL